MTILLDTSAVLGLIERRATKMREIIAAADDALLRSSFVTAELLHGVESATGLRRTNRQATLERYFSITTAPDDTPALDTLLDPYAQISSLAGRLRPRTGQNDRWILAEADASGVSRIITEDLGQAQLARKWFSVDAVDVVHVDSAGASPLT